MMTLILEAFGELPATDLINSERERERERQERENPSSGVGVTEVGLLHSAFDARTELMAWCQFSPTLII